MQQETTIHAVLTDKALSNYFQHAGDLLTEESTILGSAVKQVIASGTHVNNKNIILELIRMLECADRDVVKADVIRKTLEIVVGYTSDDL